MAGADHGLQSAPKGQQVDQTCVFGCVLGHRLPAVRIKTKEKSDNINLVTCTENLSPGVQVLARSDTVIRVCGDEVLVSGLPEGVRLPPEFSKFDGGFVVLVHSIPDLMMVLNVA